jgi:hypothetical protein
MAAKWDVQSKPVSGPNVFYLKYAEGFPSAK